MTNKPETLAELKARLEKARAANDKMISDAKTKLDEVERAIEKAERDSHVKK